MIQNWAPDIRVSIESGLLQWVEAKASGEKQTSWFAASRQLKSPRGIEGFAGKFSHKSFNPPNYTNMIFFSLSNGKRWFWLSEFDFSTRKTIFALWISCFLGNIAKLQQALPKLEAPVRIRFSTCHMLLLGRVFSCPLIFSACLFVFVSGFVCCSCSLFAVLVLCSSCLVVCSVPQTAAGRNTTSTMGKNTCEDCQKDWLYWPILGGYRFFSSLSFWGVGGTWWHGPSTCLWPPFFSQPHILQDSAF